MKVVIVWHGMYSNNYERFFSELSAHEDIELYVITSNYWPVLEGQVNGIFNIIFKNYKKIYNTKKSDKDYNIISLNPFFAGKAFYFYSNLRKHLSKIKPDLIYVNEEPWYFITAQVVLWRNLFSKKTKLIVQSLENIYRPHNHFYEQFFEKYVLKHCDYGVAIYNEIKEILIQRGFKKPIEILGLGVDTKLFNKIDVKNLKQELGLKGFVIGYAGRFAHEKGIFNLLDAFSEIKGDCQLLLIGWGELKNKMRDYSKKIGIYDRIVLVEGGGGLNISKYLNCMDLLVVPSRTTKTWKEQFGRVIVEAMACQVPVIGSDSGSIPYVIGNTGLVFKEGDSKDLKKKIELLMEDGNLRGSLIKRGSERVLNNFSWKVIAQKTYDLFKQVHLGLK